MAKNPGLSTKRIQISKANSTIVIAVGVAAAVTTFSLVASRSLLARQDYQNRVIEARESARDQLQTNIASVSSLKVAYTEFVDRPENVLGGSSNGTSDRDGDNARIVLDALPSKYDYPALASSLEKILSDRGYNIISITGTDDEVNQNNSSGAAATPDVEPATTTEPAADGTMAPAASTVTYAGNPVEMPFMIAAQGDYRKMLELLTVFKSSIRPLHIASFTLTAEGGANNLQLDINGKSFYQPEKNLNITEEVVQ